MSKIAVAGNASGTGTLTIAAPNTNSDQTITLPDASGSFVTADGSGNVTIASGIEGTKLTTAGNISLYNSSSSQLTHYQQLSSSYTASYIQSAISGASSSLVFAVNSNWTNGNAVEGMRLTSTGLGIGTSSPVAKLAVVGGTSNASDLATAYSLAAFNITPKSTSGYSLQFGSGPADLPYIQMSAGGAASGNLLVQPYGGNVGIGTSSPAARLHIAGTVATGRPAVYLENTTASTGRTYYLGANDGGTLSIHDVTAGSERLRIDASGNVGIGTTSPAAPLALSSTTPVIRLTETDSVATATNARIDFYGSDARSGYIGTVAGDLDVWMQQAKSITFGTSNLERMRIDSSGNVGIGTTSISGKLSINGEVYAAGGAASGVAYGFYPKGTYGNTGMFSPAPNTVAFATTGGERVRIDASGNLLVGVTSGNPGYTNTDTGATVRPNGLSCFSRSGADYAVVVNSNNAGTQYLIAFRASGGSVGAITSNGTSTQYATSSDYRLKENWVAVADASTRVNALKPVNFAWKATGERVDGFLAHELADVVPEAVTGEKDAVDAEGNPVYQGIDQSKLVPLLTAALQEALARIETLEADVATLKGAA